MSKNRPQPANQVMKVQTTWQGPIPPPETLLRFRELVPDAPERILAMAEEEARIRREQLQKDHDSENRVKEIDTKLHHECVRRGQWLAALVLFAIVAAIIVCALNGLGAAAAAVAGMGAAGIVSAFIERKK